MRKSGFDAFHHCAIVAFQQRVRLQLIKFLLPCFTPFLDDPHIRKSHGKIVVPIEQGAHPTLEKLLNRSRSLFQFHSRERSVDSDLCSGASARGNVLLRFGE